MTLDPERERRHRRGRTPREIHRRRSPKAQAIDESLQAKIAPSAEAWAKAPGHSDLPGIDTPGFSKKEIKGPFWRVNHESQRIEIIYPEKPSLEERKRVKGKGFRWSPKREAWVRKINMLSLTKARSLGFERADDVGTPISGVEKAEREIQRTESSVKRHEARSRKAMAEAEEHHSEAKRMMSIIPMGQPILVGHHSEKADRRYRERIHKKEGKFVEKYRESKHEKSVSERVRRKATYMKNNPTYASRKIDTLDTEIRRIEKRLETPFDERVTSSREEFDEWKEDLQYRKREATEEREYWKEHLKSLGGIKYSKSNISKGDRVRIRSKWYNVERVNQKSVSVTWQIGGLVTTKTFPYADIKEHAAGDEK